MMMAIVGCGKSTRIEFFVTVTAIRDPSSASLVAPSLFFPSPYSTSEYKRVKVPPATDFITHKAHLSGSCSRHANVISPMLDVRHVSFFDHSSASAPMILMS